MKILIANSYYYPHCNGGAEFCARSLAEQLREMGHAYQRNMGISPNYYPGWKQKMRGNNHGTI